MQNGDSNRLTNAELKLIARHLLDNDAENEVECKSDLEYEMECENDINDGISFSEHDSCSDQSVSDLEAQDNNCNKTCDDRLTDVEDSCVIDGPKYFGKKRRCHPDEWKRTKEKFARYTAKNLPIFPKCGHKGKPYQPYQCNSHLSMTDIKQFHKLFYSNRDKAAQDAFILCYCTGTPPKRSRTGKNESKIIKRSISILYTIPTKEGIKIPVCREAFLGVLDLKKDRIIRLIKKFKETGKQPIENRGGDRCSFKHINMPRRSITVDELIHNLVDYFNQEKQNNGPLIPLTAVHARVSDALKIDTKTISNALRRHQNQDENKENEPQRKSLKTKDMDERQKSEIRTTIYNMYINHEHVTLDTLLTKIKEREAEILKCWEQEKLYDFQVNPIIINPNDDTDTEDEV
ncbi:hypothetical protein RN001_003121 [Aquatica leii]|uniref:Uncharacterized protein n=1 Tax=Aquatica leii TaxID=1421715 RepID=A0AAN7QBG5_9COLE|nr:hypothetical protein RN001_003121 [Aquatica leii]